jgi:hypothetical protein
MEGGLKRQILTTTGDKVLTVLVFALVVVVIALSLAGFHG